MFTNHEINVSTFFNLQRMIIGYNECLSTKQFITIQWNQKGCKIFCCQGLSRSLWTAMVINKKNAITNELFNESLLDSVQKPKNTIR